MKTIVFGHANATGVLYSNDGLKIPVTYNIIITNNVVENLYFYSWQDQYGNDDLSNSFNFEKLEIISGNNTFYSQNEVIISEGLSRALEGKNSKLLLGVDGTQGAYNVVGVYKTFLSEFQQQTRQNNSINSNENKQQSSTIINSSKILCPIPKSFLILNPSSIVAPTSASVSLSLIALLFLNKVLYISIGTSSLV